MTHDIETGEIVHALYRRSAELGALFAALAKAQSSFASAPRDAENEGFKRGGKASRYATLESVIEATKPGLAENDLALLQMPGNQGPSIAVTTILGHGESGQWIESTFAVAPPRFDAQGAGSVITYLRRYARMAICGIAPEDDDGNAASIEAPQRLGRPPRRAGPFSKTYPVEQGFVTEPAGGMPQKSTGVAADARPRVSGVSQGAGADSGIHASPELISEAEHAASEGLASYARFWTGLTNAERRSMLLRHEGLKERAAVADAEHDSRLDEIDEPTAREPEEATT
jgi:hypothetical protein